MRFIPGPYRCEDLEMYQSGGLHPVVIGDKFNDRYSVVHKLGSGGYATVWLVRDFQENRYAALKILTADSSIYSQELKVYQHLQSKGDNEYKKCWAVPLLDSFWVDGPNGSHLCLVLELMGPSIASLQRDFLKKIRPDIVRKLALQTLLGLKELHERGVVHGDLSSGNILFRLVDINDWNIEKIYETLGKPDPCEVQKAVLSEDPQYTYEGEPLDSPEAPKFAYEPIDLSALSHDLILPEIQYIDFGEAFLMGQPREGFGVNEGYADPQTLWWHEFPDKTSDIWALACVWYEMRTAQALFEQFRGPDDVKNDIIDTLGGLPPAWIERIKKEFAEAEQRPESLEEDAEVAYNDIDQNAGTDEQKADESSFLIKFKALWHWIKSRVSRKSTKDAVEEVEQQNQNAKDVADSQDSPSLSEKIKQTGQWRKWCYLSREERREVLYQYRNYTKTADEPKEPVSLEEVGDMTPPPGPLSDEEAADFEDVLASMLKIERADRVALENLARHPWLEREYGPCEDEPWLQQYSRGRTFTIYDRGDIIEFP